MRLWHKHDWVLVDKTIEPPAITELENVRASGAMALALLDLGRQHVVHVFKCDCGKVKVVRN